MNVYRLSKAIHANDLSGKGAEKNGGRWNSHGLPMIYTSQSRALCIAEVAVHLPMGILPEDYRLITIDIRYVPSFLCPALYFPRIGNQFLHPNPPKPSVISL
jgi:RES domain-containing protein